MADGKQSALEEAALQALMRGHMDDLEPLISKVSRGSPGAQPLPPGNSPGLPAPLVDHVSYLLTLPYDDLPYSDELRRLVGAQLALGVLLWERPEAMAVRLLRVTDGEFTCPSLETFLRHNPPAKLWFYFNPNRPQDRAALYAQTRCVEAVATQRLKRLVGVSVAGEHASAPLGVAIRYAESHQCAICLPGKRLYRWSELDELPKLPHHWGCRCMYVPWEREAELA